MGIMKLGFLTLALTPIGCGPVNNQMKQERVDQRQREQADPQRATAPLSPLNELTNDRSKVVRKDLPEAEPEVKAPKQDEAPAPQSEEPTVQDAPMPVPDEIAPEKADSEPIAEALNNSAQEPQTPPSELDAEEPASSQPSDEAPSSEPEKEGSAAESVPEPATEPVAETTPAPSVPLPPVEEPSLPSSPFAGGGNIFELDERGQDLTQHFALKKSSKLEFLEALGFLFFEAKSPFHFFGKGFHQTFNDIGIMADIRLYDYPIGKATIFRLAAQSRRHAVALTQDKDEERSKDEKNANGKKRGKEKDNKKEREEKIAGKKEKNDRHSKLDVADKGKKNRAKKMRARSRGIMELSIKHGYPLLQVQIKEPAKKKIYVKLKGEDPLDVNTHVQLVIVIQKERIRLYNNGKLLAEETLPATTISWQNTDLIVGASSKKGRHPFQGFIRRLELSDLVPAGW